MDADLPYWLALIRFLPFGSVRMQKLMRRFPSMKHAFESSVSSLLEAGIEAEIANRFLQERLHIFPEVQLAELEKHGVEAITLKDPRYPPLLKTLYDPPAVLFVRGTLPDPNRKHLAVVGSRKASRYGLDMTHRLIEPLAASGVVIVSGLAYGIDATAHQITLSVNGTTLAVLGSGVDHESIYPSANRALASSIIAGGGAIISEYPVGTVPLKMHFPIRNRIIAGLCHGTLVVEATIKSGSLITARAALDAGRDVYAVPGPIDSLLSEGPNNLLKMGAIPVTVASDIHEGTRVEKKADNYIPRNEEERAIYTRLDSNPRHVDELIRATQLDITTINRTITLLEMKGVIHHEGGQYYTKKT